MAVQLSVTTLKEGKRYVAYSPALDLSTSGRTFKEAQKRFEEIANIFFEELIKQNNLAKVLEDLGWNKVNNSYQPPVVVSHGSQEVRIPVKV